MLLPDLRLAYMGRQRLAQEKRIDIGGSLAVVKKVFFWNDLLGPPFNVSTWLSVSTDGVFVDESTLSSISVVKEASSGYEIPAKQFIAVV